MGCMLVIPPGTLSLMVCGFLVGKSLRTVVPGPSASIVLVHARGPFLHDSLGFGCLPVALAHSLAALGAQLSSPVSLWLGAWATSPSVLYLALNSR